jgi:hypothetical protein
MYLDSNISGYWYWISFNKNLIFNLSTLENMCSIIAYVVLLFLFVFLLL